MKKILLIILCLFVLNGCTLNPSFKRGAQNGALIGLSSVAILSVIVVHPKNGNDIALTLIGAVVWATIGALVGGTVEYVFDDREEIPVSIL